MRVKSFTIALAALLALSACEDMSNIRTATQDEMYEWMHGTPPPKPEPRIIESRYCYKSRSDVLCYDRPQLDKEDQFVGSQ